MDPNSASEADSLISHVDLSLTIDLDQRSIWGKSVYTYTSSAESGKVVLDTRNLEILSCSHSYSLGSDNPLKGKALSITTNAAFGTFSLSYRVLPESAAIQFMAPSQTSGKQQGFCYTQCQSIHCRGLLPIMDTPQVKFTIDYHLAVKYGLKAIAAGVYQQTTESIPGFQVFHYQQAIPVPSYLVAFAVGNLATASVTDKINIYAEPEVLESARYEFEKIEEMLNVAEEILTPYFWKRLDLIVLPPSFPYGGMENPNLIFVTPTILVGDRSLTTLVAHEICHSWTGNAVTNSTWEHFWLNEGFTVYFERKIAKRLLGVETAEIEQINGLSNLKNTVEVYGASHNFTRLHMDLEGEDPEDAFSQIPYEKGCCFLLYLESLVGEKEFLAFFREYVNEFTGKNIDSNGFKEYFLKRFEVDVDWETWLRGTGMPPWLPSFNNTLFETVKNLAKEAQVRNISRDEVSSWIPEQVLMLLSILHENLNEKAIANCEVLGIHVNQNPEIKLKWYLIVVKGKIEKYYQDVERFLCSVGRMKYVRPIFRELYANGLAEMGQYIFNKCRNFYHSTLISLLSKEFNLN